MATVNIEVTADAVNVEFFPESEAVEVTVQLESDTLLVDVSGVTNEDDARRAIRAAFRKLAEDVVTRMVTHP